MMCVAIVGVMTSCSSGTPTQSTSPTAKSGLTTISVADKRLLWSPFTWVRESDAYFSPTVGAYVDVAFTGDVISVGVTPRQVGSTAEDRMSIGVSLRIDNGPPLRKTLKDLKDGQLTWTKLGPGPHRGRVTISLNRLRHSRWDKTDPSGIAITKFHVKGRVADLPADAADAPTALVYGDSLFEANGINEVYGDDSFVVTSLNSLGYRYGMHAYSLHTWQNDFLAHAGTFMDYQSDAYRPDLTWMNLYMGEPIVKKKAPHQFLEGSPDLILNSMGSNDILLAHVDKMLTSSKDYLEPAISTWVTQVRAAAGPDTAIVLVEPLVFTCAYPHLVKDAKDVSVTRDAYRAGIARYRSDHPNDKRFGVIQLGSKACTLALNDPYKERIPTLHFGPTLSKPLGAILSSELQRMLAAMPS